MTQTISNRLTSPRRTWILDQLQSFGLIQINLIPSKDIKRSIKFYNTYRLIYLIGIKQIIDSKDIFYQHIIYNV
jgi:hypothetical protein